MTSTDVMLVTNSNSLSLYRDSRQVGGGESQTETEALK